jgi:hypothetical protein
MEYLRKTVGDQLLTFVQAFSDGARDLVSSFVVSQLAVPTEAEIVAYFSGAAAGHLLNPIPTTAANGTQLSCLLCPIPLARAAYIMDSKSPYEAL